VLLNPVSQKVIGRIAGDRDQTIERLGLLRAMLLADVRNGVPVEDRAAHLAEAFGAAPEPYEDALRSYQRRPPDYLTSGVVDTLNVVLGRPAPVVTVAEEEVCDWNAASTRCRWTWQSQSCERSHRGSASSSTATPAVCRRTCQMPRRS
jgi:hypothetical protein